MFNLFPGHGLGGRTSRNIAFGLGSSLTTVIRIVAGAVKRVLPVIAFIHQGVTRGFTK